MVNLETETLRLTLHPRGASIESLIYKPLGLELCKPCQDRTQPQHYLGTLIGPIANRISGATFQIEGERFQTDKNEGENTLHGGREGLSELVWIDQLLSPNEVQFEIEPMGSHGGFPHPARYVARYKLQDSSLFLELFTKSPRPFAFGLAPHFYFNLDGTADIHDHELTVHADQYLPVDDALIPTGEIADVKGTCLDFRRARKLGDTKLDHNFCLNGTGMREALCLATPNGMSLRVETDQPGVQVYDGRHLDRSHLAIEPQLWPNTVNEPKFIDRNGPFKTERTQKSAFHFECTAQL